MAADGATALEEAIGRSNDAWNAHDVEAIVGFHAPGMVFENHTAEERVEAATATDRDGRRREWDGVDLFPFADGLIVRKDVYSASHRLRVLSG